MDDDREREEAALSQFMSPVASAWDLNHKDSSDDASRAHLEMVMSGYQIDVDEQQQQQPSANMERVISINRDNTTSVQVPRIEILPKKYSLWFLHIFKDREREREYERWFWKRNRRVWIRSVGYMFAASLCYYLQFFIAGPIQASSLSSARSVDPTALCPCYGYCSTRYSFVPDLMLLLLGNGCPILLTMALVHFTPAKSMAQIVHILSFVLATVVLNVNFAVRFQIVDPGGDSWFRTVLSMGLIFYPMMMKMSTVMTMISSALTLLIYIIVTMPLYTNTDPASQVVILVYLILCGLLSMHLMSQFEASERKAFMVSLGLLRHNDKLRLQLNRLQKQYAQGITDLDSPLEKAIMTLQSIMANPNIDMNTHSQIDKVIEWLSASENIFTPVFNRPTDDNNQLNLDDEQEKWLLDLLPAQQRRGELIKRKNRMESETSAMIMNEIPGSVIGIAEEKPSGGGLTAFLHQRQLSVAAAIAARRPSLASNAPGSMTGGMLSVNGRASAVASSTASFMNNGPNMALSNVALAGPDMPEQFSLKPRTSIIDDRKTSSNTLNLDRDLSAERLADAAAEGAATMNRYDRAGDAASISTAKRTKVSMVAAKFLSTLNSITTPSPIVLGAENQPITSMTSISNAIVSETDKIAIQNLLTDVETWNWKIFDFESMAPKPLYTLGLYMFHKAGLVGRLNLPMDKLRHFLLRIEAGYHADTPYHNATHACDVLHATHYFISSPAVAGRFSDLEVMAAYVAAIIHDFDHPGVNNQFLINTNHSKAVFYNDRSVLESHHLASAWSIISKEDANFLLPLSTEEYRAVREQVIDMVLSTDLTTHFAMLSAFKNKVLVSGNFDLGNRDDRSLFWRIVIKCGDVSNLTKEWSLYERWLERLFAEFFRQGDEEKKIGITVSPFMDRDTVQISSSQISFMDFICMPLYEAFTSITKATEVLESLQRNREILLEIKDRERHARPFSAAANFNQQSRAFNVHN